MLKISNVSYKLEYIGKALVKVNLALDEERYELIYEVHDFIGDAFIGYISEPKPDINGTLLYFYSDLNSVLVEVNELVGKLGNDSADDEVLDDMMRYTSKVTIKDRGCKESRTYRINTEQYLKLFSDVNKFVDSELLHRESMYIYNVFALPLRRLGIKIGYPGVKAPILSWSLSKLKEVKHEIASWFLRIFKK